MATWWDRVKGVFEERSSLRVFSPFEDRFVRVVDPFGQVSPEAASGHAVAHRCIQLIAETLASVPLRVYRLEGDQRTPATSSPLYGVLHDQATRHLSAFEMRESLITSLLIHGNSYARIERDGTGAVRALHPLPSGVVGVEQLPNGRLRYKITQQAGGTVGTVTLLDDEVLHLRYRLASDGFMGLSPIAVARTTFGTALAQNEEAANMTANSFRPSAVLTHPKRLSVEAQRKVVKSFEDSYIGASKANRPLLLSEGMTVESLQMSAKDSEFLDSRKLSNLDVARIFGVPPTVCGIVDNATYSNVEGESRALVQRTLAPMARRIEQAMMVQLLSPEARRTTFIEHELAGLMRGDDRGRFDAYRLGIQFGWLTRNEARKLENLPALDGLDTPLEPVNMQAPGEDGDDD